MTNDTWKEFNYRDGDMIHKEGKTYILKYIKGYGWKAFKIKDVKSNLKQSLNQEEN